MIVGGAAPGAKQQFTEEYEDDEEFCVPAVRRTSSAPHHHHQQHLPLMPTMPLRRPRVHRAAGPAHPYNSSMGGPMTLPRTLSDQYAHARPTRPPVYEYDEDEEDMYDGGYVYVPPPRVGTKRGGLQMRRDGEGGHRQGWTGALWNTQQGAKQVPAESSASQVCEGCLLRRGVCIERVGGCLLRMCVSWSFAECMHKIHAQIHAQKYLCYTPTQASRDGASFMLLLSAIDELQRSGDDSATVMQPAEARPRGACDEVSSPAPKKQALGIGREEASVPTSNESSTSQVCGGVCVVVCFGLLCGLCGGCGLKQRNSHPTC